LAKTHLEIFDIM